MIGTGGMARRHLRALSAMTEDIEIVGHASPTPGHAEAAAAQWGGRAYRDHEALLAQEAVDAAWIVIPPDQHGMVERTLIAHGIPFLVDKPLAADLQTAEEIATLLLEAQATARRPLIAAVGYHWRAMDTVAGVRETLARRPPRLILAAWHGATPSPAWWQRREQSGGQLVEQATHLFDFARYMNGEATVLAATADHLPRAAFPDLNVDTSSAVLLRFDNGAAGMVSATCLLQGAPEVYIKFISEGLTVTVERSGVIYEDGHERREVRLQGDAVRDENIAFLKAVRENDPSYLYSSYEDALKSHHLCWTAQQMASSLNL